MKPCDDLQILEQVAAPVLAAIERDEMRAPKRLQPLFRAMRELIFLPDLELEDIATAAGIEDLQIFSELVPVQKYPS